MKQVLVKYLPKLDYAATEAVNTLCNNITFTSENVKTLLLTSCREHEGKSSLSICVWNTLAEMGYKAVIIDADLRRSMLNGRCGLHFNEGDGKGLAHFLSQNTVTEDDIVYETNIKNAYLVPLGREVVNSMQLLSNNRLGRLLTFLKEKFDYIIIDTPPVGAIVDAATIARNCDGALIVVTQNRTTKQEVLNAKTQIERTGCPVLGTVLNRVAMNRSSSRYYSASYYSTYKSGYYSSGDKKKHGDKKESKK